MNMIINFLIKYDYKIIGYDVYLKYLKCLKCRYITNH
jgi:hypothetical protein